MAQKITGLRVVQASPSDVKREREAFAKVVDQVNNDMARPAGFHLDLWRWETDSRPGFNPKGPQGLIDKALRIDQCDLFIGIFWNRIGSPTKFGTFPEDGLYCPYKGHAEFVKYANDHLRKFIHEYVGRQNGGKGKKRPSVARTAEGVEYDRRRSSQVESGQWWNRVRH
jgi:hypothetical protein